MADTNGVGAPSDPGALPAGPHFLESEWVIWEHRIPEKSASYEDNMAKLCDVSTIEDFWRAWNNIPQPSQLFFDGRVRKKFANRTVEAFSVFKKNIKPEWEDPANREGAELFCRKAFPLGQLDEYWLNLVLGMIGETIDGGDEICGARVCDKSLGTRCLYRLELWFRKNDETLAKELQRERAALALPPALPWRTRVEECEGGSRAAKGCPTYIVTPCPPCIIHPVAHPSLCAQKKCASLWGRARRSASGICAHTPDERRWLNGGSCQPADFARRAGIVITAGGPRSELRAAGGELCRRALEWQGGGAAGVGPGGPSRAVSWRQPSGIQVYIPPLEPPRVFTHRLLAYTSTIRYLPIAACVEINQSARCCCCPARTFTFATLTGPRYTCLPVLPESGFS